MKTPAPNRRCFRLSAPYAASVNGSALLALKCVVLVIVQSGAGAGIEFAEEAAQLLYWRVTLSRTRKASRCRRRLHCHRDLAHADDGVDAREQGAATGHYRRVLLVPFILPGANAGREAKHATLLERISVQPYYL
jgi:hypothetical protein